MRHDEHFVEALVSPRGEAVGHMVDVERIVPNPNQPRKEFKDLEEIWEKVDDKEAFLKYVRENVTAYRK